MIKRADTPDEIKRVREYLTKNAGEPATNLFYYTENKGEITGAYGIEEKICIEPLYAEDTFTSFELFTDAIATARTLGQNKIHILTDNPKVVALLKDKYRAIEWGKEVTELLIPISNNTNNGK